MCTLIRRARRAPAPSPAVLADRGADDRDDAAIPLDRHVAELRQIARPATRGPTGSSTVTDTDTSDVATTSTDVRLLEDLEDAPQKAAREQHSRRADLDQRDVALARDRADRAARRVEGDPRSLPSGLRELKMNTGMPSRTAGAIVFGCSTFAPNDASSDASSNRICSISCASFHDARIGGQHAVDIGPDLDRLGVQRGAEQRRAVVRAAAAERRRDPAAVSRR